MPFTTAEYIVLEVTTQVLAPSERFPDTFMAEYKDGAIFIISDYFTLPLSLADLSLKEEDIDVSTIKRTIKGRCATRRDHIIYPLSTLFYSLHDKREKRVRVDVKELPEFWVEFYY